MLLTPFENDRADIREECLAEALFRIDLFVAFLVPRQLLMIDRGGFGKQLLSGDSGLYHRLDFWLVDMRLVDHVRDLRRLLRFPGKKVNFVKDPERLVRVDRS